MGWRTLRYLLTARCRDATRVASDECDGPVTRADWWAARLHWIACRPCRRSCRQIALVDRLVKSAPTEIRERLGVESACLDAEATRRIEEALASARRHDR